METQENLAAGAEAGRATEELEQKTREVAELKKSTTKLDWRIK